MDLDRLKSVIGKIRTVSTDEKVKILPSLEAIIVSIRGAFQDCWQQEYVPLAARIAQIFDRGLPTSLLKTIFYLFGA